jgi:NADPH2:quinone reductase
VAGVRAIQVAAFGGPEVLVPVLLDEPVPGPGEAVIAVSVADVLFLDTMIRSGRFGAGFPITPPYVPGNGVAGEVVATGDGVDRSWTGQAVVAHTGPHGGSDGYAERVGVGASRLVPVPDGTDPRVAAAVMHDGATALGLMARIGTRPGEWVLVLGAAGGMGLLLVQLARAAGARVIGAARTSGTSRADEKLTALVKAGAEVVVDYSSPQWISRVAEVTGGSGPDVVFDGIGGPFGRAAFAITAAGGRFYQHGVPGGGFAGITPEMAAQRGVQVQGIEQAQYAPGQREKLIGLALSEAAAGRIEPVIGQVFPLESAARAHAAIAARTVIGKTLLTNF